jgi:hypothetical protein
MSVRVDFPFSVLGASALFIGVTGVRKAARPWGFAEVVGRWRLFPDRLILPFALVFPLVELFVAAFWWGSRAAASPQSHWSRAADAVLAVLLAVLAAGRIALRALRGPVACGCFGGPAAPGRGAGGDVVTNTAVAFLAVLALAAAFASQRNATL